MLTPTPPPAPVAEVRAANQSNGMKLKVGGIESKGSWLWVGDDRRSPQQLWIPLDLLIGRLGFQRGRSANAETLEWFGQQSPLGSLGKRSLGDEVAIDAAPWFRSLNVTTSHRAGVLSVALKTPRVLKLRQGRGSMAGRLVFDLTGPALVQRQNNDLLLGVSITAPQAAQLRKVGLKI